MGQQLSAWVRNDQQANLSAGPVAGYTGRWDASGLAGADGSPVSTWPDLSAGGHDWTAAANQPVLYKTTSAKLINGHPALYFDPAASTRMLFSGAGNIAQPYSVFMVATILGLPASNGPLFVDSGWDGCHVTMPGGYWGMYAGSYVNGPAVTVGTAAAVAFVFNGATSSVTKDAATTSGLNPGGASLGSMGGFLGMAPGSPYANMLMGELFFYPFALSPAQISSMHSYAQSKWGTP